MENRDSVPISKRVRVDYQILRGDVPTACWVTWRIMGIERWLLGKIRQGGQGRSVWKALLALHKDRLVGRAELELLNLWYGLLCFNPQRAAKRLGSLIPRSLRDRLSATQAQFDISVRRMLPLALLFALTGLAGLAADLSFYVFMLLALWDFAGKGHIWGYSNQANRR